MTSEHGSPSCELLMVVTWSLADDTGYTINTRRALCALEQMGCRVVVCQVVDWRHYRQARDWARSHEGHTLLLPPDLGLMRVRRFWMWCVGNRIRSLASRYRLDAIHARGIRAGALVADADLHPVLLDVRGDLVAEERLSAEMDPTSRSLSRVRSAQADELRAMMAADAVCTVSDAMLDWVLTAYPHVSGLPVRVVPCSVEAFASIESPPHSGLRVVYAGGLQAYQSSELVFRDLARVARIADATDVLVYTPDVSRATLQRRDEICPQAEVRSLDATAVMLHLAECDLGIIPREVSQVNWVACPTKIAEYLAAGLPIAISPALGRWPDRLAAWGVGISLDADEGELRSFCERVRSDRSEMRDLCRRIAAEHFSMRAVAESYVEVIERIRRGLP